MSELDLNDIQGLILRGYRKAFARHLVLQMLEPSEFKAMLGSLAEEDTASGPFITVAEDWSTKPSVWRHPNRERHRDGHRARHDRKDKRPASCVNIGFTFDGLTQLALDASTLQSFPEAFRQGAVERAQNVCETGPSAPEHWLPSLRSGDAHAIVALYADDLEELTDVTDEICRLAGDGAALIDSFDAQWLDGDVEPFGYVDGLSQPTIEGAPRAGLKDPFPPVPAGEFVLGQPAMRTPTWDPVPQPPA
jgi:deferrochelatase/peroxidase EfeB